MRVIADCTIVGGEEMISPLHERISALMKEREIGMNEMDRRLGYSEGYTSRMLKESRDIRVSTLIKIADVLAVPADRLLCK